MILSLLLVLSYWCNICWNILRKLVLDVKHYSMDYILDWNYYYSIFCADYDGLSIRCSYLSIDIDCYYYLQLVGDEYCCYYALW